MSGSSVIAAAARAHLKGKAGLNPAHPAKGEQGQLRDPHSYYPTYHMREQGWAFNDIDVLFLSPPAKNR